MTRQGWEPGKILADRYRIEEKIGSGGMGEVWRAQHIKLASPVAIKVLPAAVGDEPKRSARFMREAQAAAAIRSTNVVHVLDYGVEDGLAYIAMEYLEGESLDARLDYTGRLTAVETLNVVVQVAKAIGRAHKRGIVHRDLKPANIFIADEDEGEVVKVLDFGIAKLVDDDKKPDDTTVTGTVLGTPYYMSPEQARGHKVVDHRTDLWALGIIAFECITGERPVDGASVGDIIYKICSLDMPKPSQLAPVPVGFDAWFEKATSRDAEDRFQSARKMATALRDLMAEDGSLALSSSRDSLDSIDPMLTPSNSRAELEMLDTLAARRQLSQPPAPISDSWDSTGDDISVERLPSSRSFSDVHEAQTLEHKAEEAAPKKQSEEAPEAETNELDSNSIRVAGGLARSNGPPARGQRGLLAAIALGVATVSGAAALTLTSEDEPAAVMPKAPAGQPAPGPVKQDEPETAPEPQPVEAQPKSTSTTEAPDDTEAKPPPPQVRSFAPMPTPQPKADPEPKTEPEPKADPEPTADPEPKPDPEPKTDPSPQPKDGGKIDFGI